MNKLFLTGFILFYFAVSSCAHYPAGFAPSTSPVETTDVTIIGHAKGKHSYFNLLGLFPFKKPDYDAAIKDALKNYPEGKTLINVRSTFTRTFVVIGYIEKLEVEGDVVK